MARKQPRRQEGLLKVRQPYQELQLVAPPLGQPRQLA